MKPSDPPRTATRWLERWLPPHEQVELIGDLDEEFEERVLSHGARAARRWYWRQTCVLLLSRRSLGQGGADTPLRRTGVLTDIGADWRLAIRSIRRAPVISTVALLSLTVSLGLATAVLSIVNTVLLEPLPFATADRIVRLGMAGNSPFDNNRAQPSVGGPPAPPVLPDVMIGNWLERRGSLDAIATYNVSARTVTIQGDPMRIDVADVGPEFFTVFPVRPVMGRALHRGDAAVSASKVVLLSERVTTQRSGDAPGFIGQSLLIDEVPHEIVGILPRDFDWPDQSIDVWAVDRSRWPTAGAGRQMFRSAYALGLIRQGRTPDDVQREGQHIAETLSSSGAPLGPGSVGPPVVVVRGLKNELIQPMWPALVLLMAGTAGVLIAANVNLAGFLLSRNSARRRDLGVRQALGASWWRLVRPLVCEQLLLGAAGATGALALAWAVLEILPAVVPHNLPRLSQISLNGEVLLFAWVASLVTALIVGLLPARGLAATSLRTVVADGGASMAGTSRQAERSRRVLVVSQLSVATVLLVGSVLIGRSLLAMLHVDPGYRPAGVLTFQVGTVWASTRQPGRLTQLYGAIADGLRAEPSVVSVGTSSGLPLHGRSIAGTFDIPGVTPPQAAGMPMRTVEHDYVSADYLQTIGATLHAGRFFGSDDTAQSERVAIVNDTFVRTFMPGVEPVGYTLATGVRRFSIVGVVAQVKRGASTLPDMPVMYMPAVQGIEAVSLSSSASMGVAVRTTGAPMALAPVVRRIVRELDPSLPVYNMMPLKERFDRTFAQPRFFAIALTMFAGLALVTALLGVYGILASSVERRQVELGVRRALGASAGDVVTLIIGHAMPLAGVGITIGLALAAVGAVFGRSALYGIAAMDGLSYLAAVVTVLVTVLLGAWVPVRAALLIDPARVLKNE